MKKIYEKPIINIVKVSTANVITESSPTIVKGSGGLLTDYFTSGFENAITY